MNYLKALIMTPFIWVGAKVFGFLYKKELNELKQIEANKKKIADSMKEVYNNAPLREKQKLESYSKLQNEILKVFIQYSQEIQQVDGQEMAEVAELWVQTVNGLNKTFQKAFAHQDEISIKKHLYAVQQECQIIVDSNQEILPGYRGPIGNA